MLESDCSICIKKALYRYRANRISTFIYILLIFFVLRGLVVETLPDIVRPMWTVMSSFKRSAAMNSQLLHGVFLRDTTENDDEWEHLQVLTANTSLAIHCDECHFC